MSCIKIDKDRLKAKCFDTLEKLSEIKQVKIIPISTDNQIKIEETCESLLRLCKVSDETLVELDAKDAYWLEYIWERCDEKNVQMYDSDR